MYEATVDGLASFAYGMLGNRAAAEDAVQQAFLELVTAAPGLRGDGRSLRVWLYRSVRFTCLDELRRRGRRPEHLTDRLPEYYEEPVPDVAPELEEALARLSDRQRSLLMLRHVAGLSPDEIARVTRSNRGAVYAAIARAEKKLRLFLDPVVRP